MPKSDELQDLSHKRGEVEFRRILFRQQVRGERLLEDEFDGIETEAILVHRMEQTRRDIERLLGSGVQLTPYLEVGAERGQRALVLENDFGCEGAALDLSHDLLVSCKHYASRLGKSRLPMRMCADMYSLPFRSDSLPFIFCYQTLHHFPQLEPVLREIHRVLAPGGCFFFAEEPFRPGFRIPLLKSKGGVRRSSDTSRISKLLRRFFVSEYFNEEEYGVLENHDMSLGDWRKSLEIFAYGSSTIELDRFRADIGGGSVVTESLLRVLGGRIRGTYRKQGELVRFSPNIASALMEPICRENQSKSPLTLSESSWIASTGNRFPIVDDVAMLLCPDLLKDLYPEFSVG